MRIRQPDFLQRTFELWLKDTASWSFANFLVISLVQTQLEYSVKTSVCGVLFLVVMSAQCQSATPRPKLSETEQPGRESAAATNTVALAGKWHSVKVTPRPGLPKIHTHDKFNPVWWFKNSDEPVPPAWYKPHDKRRNTKWRLRNPLHNFDNYVIGIADKKFVRSGRYPERNSSPRSGWDFAVAKYKWLRLPFVSYERSRFHFYLGWRERGNFGIKVNIK